MEINNTENNEQATERIDNEQEGSATKPGEEKKFLSWKIDAKGNRAEIQKAVDATAGCPDSVKGFVLNATAYYTDDTQLTFNSHGLAQEGLIVNCTIQIAAQLPQAAPKSE